MTEEEAKVKWCSHAKWTRLTRTRHMYGYAVYKPEAIGSVVIIAPPFWKSLWYSFTGLLYDAYLLSMIALCITVATQPYAVYQLVKYLINGV